MRTIYVLGNPLLRIDSLAVRLIPQLQKLFPNLTIIHFDPTEEFIPLLEDELVFIDTILGIKKVRKFNDLNHFLLSPRNTIHDFDLPISLGILKKLGKIKKTTIIGIPTNGNKKEIVNDIKNILTKIVRSHEFSQSVDRNG